MKGCSQWKGGMGGEDFFIKEGVPGEKGGGDAHRGNVDTSFGGSRP